MTELPNAWVQIALGEALQIQKGKKPIGLGPKGEDRSIPYINISAFETKQVEEYAPEQDVPRCQPSDTLLVWDGARAGLAGRGVGGFIGSTLARLTSDLADSSYLYYFVHSNYGYLNTHTKGVGIPHIDPIVLAEISFPLPPASEQTRIVAKLEELLTDLDAGVAELKAAQKKLAQYRQSLLKAAVEGALTAGWRAQNKASETGAQLLQRILTERRARWEAKQLAKFAEQGKTPPKDWQNKYPEPVQPDTTDLPKLPEGWAWASGEQLCEFITKGTTPPKEFDADGVRTIPFLRVTNLTDGGKLDLTDKVFVSEETHKGFLARSVVYPNDVLMNIVGPPLGQVAVVPSTFSEWNINQAIAIFRAVYGVLPSFICRYLLSSVAQQWLKVRSKTTAGQTNLTLEVCRCLPIPLPPEAEQQALLASLDVSLDSMGSQVNSIEIALKQSTAQRQNILRAAFAGQLVKQDPNDEPANALLERIRAERAERAKQPKTRKTKPKEIATMVSQLIDVLAEAGDWVQAQEAFRRCGVADGALTERIEELYAELRKLDKAGRLAVEAVTDAQGRKLYDKLKLLAG